MIVTVESLAAAAVESLTAAESVMVESEPALALLSDLFPQLAMVSARTAATINEIFLILFIAIISVVILHYISYQSAAEYCDQLIAPFNIVISQSTLCLWARLSWLYGAWL